MVRHNYDICTHGLLYVLAAAMSEIRLLSISQEFL